MTTPIVIAPGHPNLRVRVPHLMPFHIHHTGLAPVSTYFRIQPAPLPPTIQNTHPAPSPESGAQFRTDNVAATTAVTLDDKENDSVAGAPVTVTATTEVDRVAKAPAPRLLRPGLIERLSESAKRFVSSFRGRTVHGVEVALPKGYVGTILRGDGDGQTYTAAGRAKRRPTWQLREIPAEGCMYDAPGILLDEEGPVRMLRPTARFDSFVLWHPDIPVDEGKDEYLRSLSEWVNISAEVRVSDYLSLRLSGDDAQTDPSKRMPPGLIVHVH
jgi:hypothetical protein